MKLSLPENICALRKERSMTQEQLAEALGVTFASVSKWEHGGFGLILIFPERNASRRRFYSPEAYPNAPYAGWQRY